MIFNFPPPDTDNRTVEQQLSNVRLESEELNKGSFVSQLKGFFSSELDGGEYQLMSREGRYLRWELL